MPTITAALVDWNTCVMVPERTSERTINGSCLVVMSAGGLLIWPRKHPVQRQLRSRFETIDLSCLVKTIRGKWLHPSNVVSAHFHPLAKNIQLRKSDAVTVVLNTARLVRRRDWLGAYR